MKIYKYILGITICLCPLLVTTGCCSKESTPANSNKSVVDQNIELKITNPAEKEFLSVESSLKLTKFRYFQGTNAVEITARHSEKGITKYLRADNSLVCKTNHKAESFDVLDANNSILWKVSANKGIIQITKGNDETKPFQIKLKKQNSARIINKDSTQIGKITFYPSEKKLKIFTSGNNELFICKTKKLRPSIGVLMFEGMLLDQKAAIITELLKLGY